LGGGSPGAVGLGSWEEGFRGPLHLVFEERPSLASELPGLDATASDGATVHMLKAGHRSIARLEGQTHPGALLIDETSGLAVILECKVSSDVSF